jgi:hypothetical protein
MVNTNPRRTWELSPFERVGELQFGMTREQVIEVLGEPDAVLYEQAVRVEGHEDLRVQPCYDPDGRLIAVQLLERTPFSVRGLRPAGRELDEVQRELVCQGVRCQLDRDGMTLPDLGLQLYAPQYSFPEPRPIEGVLAMSRDYETILAENDQI